MIEPVEEEDGADTDEKSPKIIQAVNFQVTVRPDDSHSNSSSSDIPDTPVNRTVFYCIAGTSLRIDNIQYLTHGQADDDNSCYNGPFFNQLNPNVQRHFIDYLSARGVDQDLLGFIVRYAEMKEREQYMIWLHKLLFFIES